ncbi:hypothetical protein BU24DRAFT_386137 [Aaosphaeria arxii CBS 175.79]|uniref:DUF2415 domain-containing protein n=1 Tax=Aaosphaeria arxii CBS 175.79 TaxID=1450172 RepID=A0A6A5Y217_9PLEO|nr:uncharacterized protein BU24DRAFT_386137 [Aaosphaeria arxii CBS 175.79]KAF2019286.1 hypothetical protein BU24DRAFT_386137 [Aaosphaeria arxii CBS 175.79]
MAVTVEDNLRDTDSFVLPSKSYYPLDIPIAHRHYQLRHFISSPEQDVLYYASKLDLYCLNSATKTQAHITKLPWEARCTASGHGYVCVGGADDGNFAAIKVTGFPPTVATTTTTTDVDALLPIELGGRTSIPQQPHQVRLEKIGEDIVNSISIHKYTNKEGADDVVAVLTNNDKTVRIYSLTREVEDTVMDLPFAMNHATISPDGELLLAVGDLPTAYFFKRFKPRKTDNSLANGETTQKRSWILWKEVPLYVPPGAGSVQGYFTTAWSPSGRLCAVGSECGYITVFDPELLTKCKWAKDAAVQLISSTRPDTTNGPGSIRTMQFSPAPWDLLIWSEDQARVCVADLRRGFGLRRQVLNLDPREDNLERVEVADYDGTLGPVLQDLRLEADFIRRYRRALDSESRAAAVNYASDYIEASSERRRLHRQLGVVESDNDPHGLTAHERQILEALRSTRQREEGREQTTTPRSINYTSDSPPARRSRLNWFSTWDNEPREGEGDAPPRRNMGETLAEFITEGSRNHRILEQSRGQEPRRRASIIISNEGSPRMHEPTGNITDAATTRSPNPIPAHARRGDPQIIASTDEAWRRVEEALASNTLAADSARSSNAPELRSDLRRLRQLTQVRDRLRSAREAPSIDPYNLPALGTVYRFASRSSHHDPAFGVRTAGLAMSQDGRILYCGTEEGIFEFRINMHERKGRPAIALR